MSELLPAGINRDDLSTEIRPQDDLYRYVNDRWMQSTPIPADKSGYGAFEVLREESEAAIREIVEAAGALSESVDAKKVSDLYASFMDEERIETLGSEPLRADMALADSVTSFDELVRVVGELQRAGLSGFFGVFVDTDPGNPERYLVFLEQGGISLPNENYYREEQFASVREAYVVHIEKMFELAGIDDARARAQRVFDLETAIAKRHWDNVATRDSEKTYNPMEWTSVRDLFAAGLPDIADVTLDVWASTFGAPEHALDEVVVREPSFFRDLAELFDEGRLDAWRDWLRWRIVRGYAPYLSRAFVDEQFDFYGRTLTGAQELRARWKRGVSIVEGALGEAVGQIYVEQHFPPLAKTRMDELVANLIEAYRQSISTLDWMTPATRERALEKLAAFTPKIGYPVKWRDYSALVIEPESLIANVRSANAFEFQRELAKIGGPIDRDEWFMTPQTVNAYYNPGFNEIVFPAAILQWPFFVADRDDAANYGGIGAVIGHEIGHGFDDQGSKFDGTGKLIDWWEPADRDAFEARTKALIDQYNALSPAETPGQHVNGALTIGENIGDLGGLGIAWQAYLIALKGAEPPVIDGLTGAERFLLSWALCWQYKARTEEVERRLAIDPHSPPEFRCNQVVRNIDEFYEAFGVAEGDALWLEPDQRVSIW
ncbi:MAG TPA: M13-type metalloendopeptidase [Acidimicrobiales bacterium]|nr:M13-type metalloendopeptidase [Acidimicrobiales bacterium]